MGTRPELRKGLDGAAFRGYYYLKEELTDFCRANALPTSGGKGELTERIAHYLDTGEVIQAKPAVRANAAVGVLAEDMAIEPSFVCSERHRAFFREKIGPGFSFPTAFQKWLKGNTGKTYAQAIEAYYQIVAEKKAGVTVIDPQFEYNTYIRDFFADNPGKSLAQAIACWKYKKARQGHHRYERSDLTGADVEFT